MSRTLLALFLAAGALGALPTASFAAEAYAGVGSTGYELGVAQRLGDRTGLRVDAEFLNHGHDFARSGARYDATLKFSSLGVFADYFLGDTFRLTGGALLGTRKATGTAVATNGSITVNGVNYPAGGESLAVEVSFPSVSPYLGVGLGHGRTTPGFNFYLDIGVAFGRAEVSLRPSAGLLAAAGQANIDAEQANVQEGADHLRAYPAVKLGLGYRF